MHIHPYYQYLTAELFRCYGIENNLHNDVVRKLILRATGLNNDTYYKLMNTVKKPAKLQAQPNNFRTTTLNAIARLVKGCSDAHAFTRKYPIPTDLALIDATKCFWELSGEQKADIRNYINAMLQEKPFEWATKHTPEEPSENLSIFDGNYLLFYCNKESYSFRVAPLTISNGSYIELRRYKDLLLTGTLRVRGASVAATLASAKPTSKYFEILFAKPRPNTETIDTLTVTIMYARTHELSARHGVGLCLPISVDNLKNFVFRDNFTEQQLHTLPIQLTAQQIGLLYAFPVFTFDFVESNQTLKKFSKHHHDGCFNLYFCRNESEQKVFKLPILIKNGVVRMKHPRIEQNYIGKWKFKNPVLWIYMETIDDGENYVDEDFVIQLKIDGLTLSDEAIGRRFYGVYTTTRSYGSLPIAGNLIFERAVFNYDQATGEVIDLATTPDAELHRLMVWYQGQ